MTLSFDLNWDLKLQFKSTFQALKEQFGREKHWSNIEELVDITTLIKEPSALDAYK